MHSGVSSRTDTAEEPIPGGLVLVGKALFFFCLFPYVQIIHVPTDAQPYALVAAGLIFLLGRRVKLPMSVWALFITVSGALAFFVLFGPSMNGFRSLMGYMSVFLISASVLILARHKIYLDDRTLNLSVYIWTFVGLLQAVTYKNFLGFLVSRTSTSAGRGVVGLAVEPSAYATVMLLFLTLYFLRGRERSLPALLCVVQIIFFAQSALGILFALMALGFVILLRLSIPTATIALASLVAGSIFVFLSAEWLLSGTRIGQLMELMLKAPERVLLVDGSVAARVANVFYSVYGSFDDWLTPHGFDAWQAFAYGQSKIYRGVFINDQNLYGDRIMSGYGAAVFELGYFGLIIPAVMSLAILGAFSRQDWARSLAMLIFVSVLLVMPVPLALPTVGLLMGQLLVKWDVMVRLRTSRARKSEVPVAVQLA